MAGKPTYQVNFSPKMQSLIERWQLCRQLELDQLTAEVESQPDSTFTPKTVSYSTLFGIKGAASMPMRPQADKGQEAQSSMRKAASPAA